MKTNRSIPTSSVIPELAYRDVGEAAKWLRDVFGFKLRLRIADHRVQLTCGDGAVVAIELPGGEGERPAPPEARTHSVLVRVEDAQRHHDHARSRGARILLPPTDYPFGERQYSAEDPGGHRWTFSETIADVDPAAWGGTTDPV